MPDYYKDHYPDLSVKTASSVKELIRLNADAFDKKATELERTSVLPGGLLYRSGALQHRTCAQVLRELSELADKFDSPL